MPSRDIRVERHAPRGRISKIVLSNIQIASWENFPRIFLTLRIMAHRLKRRAKGRKK